MTEAHFWDVGNKSLVSEVLNSLTMNGDNSLAYFLIIHVGAGSSSQNLHAAELIKRLTAASSRSSKSSRLERQHGPSKVGGGAAAVAERTRSSFA